MINLLPEQYKNELKDEENFRLTLILGILILLSFVVFSLLLLSIRIYVAGQIQTQKILVESQREDYGDKDPVTQIRELNLIVNATSSFYKNQVMVSDILTRLTASLPAGLYITSFNYTSDKSTSASGQTIVARISLFGITPTTNDLLTLKTNIESDTLFSDLVIPPEVWKNPSAKDVEFSIRIEVNASDE